MPLNDVRRVKNQIM